MLTLVLVLGNLLAPATRNSGGGIDGIEFVLGAVLESLSCPGG